MRALFLLLLLANVLFFGWSRWVAPSQADSLSSTGSQPNLRSIRLVTEQPASGTEPIPAVRSALGDAVAASRITHGELTLDIQRDKIVEVLTFLRDDAACQFEVLIDICGVDWPARKERFDVVYHLLSPRLNQRIRLKLTTNEQTPVPSTVGVFPASNWFEREAYDMYGILFSGHPDLRRLLLYEEFVGHPLRKDYPINRRQPLIGPKI